MNIHTILCLPQVKQRKDLSRSTIHLPIKNRQFKASNSLDAGCYGWLEFDLSDFNESRDNPSSKA